jgi:hypothetical protein
VLYGTEEGYKGGYMTLVVVKETAVRNVWMWRIFQKGEWDSPSVHRQLTELFQAQGYQYGK